MTWNFQHTAHPTFAALQAIEWYANAAGASSVTTERTVIGWLITDLADAYGKDFLLEILKSHEEDPAQHAPSPVGDGRA
jgi:hypothetical protein